MIVDGAGAAVVASGFGFQGQKCSACSRLIVDEAIYDRFVPMVAEKTKALRMGPAEYGDAQVGPVVNKSSMEKIKEYIDKGRKEGGRLVAGGEIHPNEGFFVEPTVIADVDPHATIAQEEIFGPVLAGMKAKDFDHAPPIANHSPVGPTGAGVTRHEGKPPP